MGVVFSLSVRQLSGRWRLLVVAGLVMVAVVLASVHAALAPEVSGDDELIDGIFGDLFFSAIMPLVAMVLATAAFGNEVEDRTLSYLVLKPIPRWGIALSKYAAPLVVGGPFLLAAGVTSALVALDRSPAAAVAVAAALAAGLLAYGAIFTWAGLVTNRALAYALAYVLIWEGMLSSILEGIRYLSVRWYALSILHWLDEDRFGFLGPRVIETPAAIAGLAIVTAVFLFLTVRRLERMDVP